jgi:hypothetical protein
MPKQLETSLIKNSSLPKDIVNNSEKTNKVQIQSTRNEKQKENISNFNTNTNNKNEPIKKNDKAKIGNLTERKAEKNLAATDRNFYSNRASLINLNQKTNNAFKPKNTFSNYMANAKSKINNNNNNQTNKINITVNSHLGKSINYNKLSISNKNKVTNEATKLKFANINKNINIIKKFSEESPQKAKEKAVNYINKFKKNEKNIGSLKSNIFINNVRAKKEKLKLI